MPVAPRDGHGQPTNTASSSLRPVHALEPFRSLWLYEYSCTLLSIQFNSLLLFFFFFFNLNGNFKKYLILLLFLKILSLFAFSYFRTLCFICDCDTVIFHSGKRTDIVATTTQLQCPNKHLCVFYHRPSTVLNVLYASTLLNVKIQ